MDQTRGFQKSDSKGNPLVCRLLKPLYGLKQAGRIWYRTLLKYLKSLGYIPCKSDPCFLVRVCENEKSYLCIIWVADIIFCSTDVKFLETFKVQIFSQFRVSECT